MSNKKKIKTVQVFLKDNPQSAEISNEYRSYKIEKGCLWLQLKEGTLDWVHMFPLTNISQVRFYEEEE